MENGSATIEMTSNSTDMASATDNLNAPTQEEEEEELRRRPLPRRILETVFPHFTRPVGGVIRSIRRRSARVS